MSNSGAVHEFAHVKILTFWVDCDYQDRKKEYAGWTRSQLLAEILHEYEEAGDAMRYLNARGQITWRYPQNDDQAGRRRTRGPGRCRARLDLMPRATEPKQFKFFVCKDQSNAITFIICISTAPCPAGFDPYSLEALRQDLQRVRNAWEECQSNRSRDAIYGYLNAVYALVTWWAAEGQEIFRARRSLRLRGLDASAREGPFAALIRCTADPAKADKRTRSKWSRVMRYAAEYKPD